MEELLRQRDTLEAQLPQTRSREHLVHLLASPLHHFLAA